MLNGTKYSALTTLLAQSDLTVQVEALKNEEAHWTGVAAAAASVASSVPQTAAPATSGYASSVAKAVERCFKFEEYSKKAKEDVAKESSSNSKKRCNNGRKGKPNAAQEAPTPESAGVASIRFSSSPSALECRHRGHFSYDTSSRVVQVLHL